MCNDKDSRKLVYLTYGSVSECSVFRTQILDLLEDLHKDGIDLHLFVLLSIRNIFNKKIKNDRRYLDKSWFNKYTYIYLSAHNKISVCLSALMIFLKLLGSILKREKIIMHCRGEIPVMVSAAFRRLYGNTEIIYDKRGMTSDEYIYEAIKKNTYDENDEMISFFRRLEELSVVESDKFLCVSYEMKQHMISKYRLDAERIGVVPCCASLDKFYFDIGARNQVRHEIGAVDKLVFIYSGSLYGWQMFDSIVEIFRQVNSRIKDTFLLVCTGDKDTTVLSRLPEDSFRVVHADSGEMFKYYSAADYGIILRENSIVNMVSSPVKIAEYIACRLPFIATKGIGDTKNIVGKENKECIFVKASDSISDITGKIMDELGNRDNWTVRLDTDMREYFNRKRYLEIYKKMYYN